MITPNPSHKPNESNTFNPKVAESLARIKFKEKEIKLLSERMKACDAIIISSIKRFTMENNDTFDKHKDKVHIYVSRMEKENYAAYNKNRHKFTSNNSQIVKNCVKVVENITQNWKGYTPKKDINTFPEYFQVAEIGWKPYSNMIAKHFRESVSAVVYEFAKHAAQQFFCGMFMDIQQLYASYLQTLVSKNLFQEMMTNPGLTCKILNSKKISQEYIWMEQKTAEKTLTKQREFCEHSKRKFQNSMLALHYEVDNYNSAPENDIHTCNMKKENGAHNVIHPPIIPVNCFKPSASTVMANQRTYTNHHQSNVQLKDYRYDPMGRTKY